jgi:hypothetical protein
MVWRLSPGAWAFLTALRGGSRIAAAIDQGSRSDADFDLQECFDVLVQTGIAVGLSLPERRVDAHM